MQSLLKYALCIAWIVILIVFNFTEDINAVIGGQGWFRFYFTPDVDLVAELSTYYINVNDPLWVQSKLGHFLGFFVLGFLFLSSFKSKKKAVAAAASVGIATEILQPYFSRSGQVLDMIINVGSVLVAYYIYEKLKPTK